MDQIKFPEFILLKKLNRIIEVVVQNEYLKSVGTNVISLVFLTLLIHFQKRDLTRDDDAEAMQELEAKLAKIFNSVVEEEEASEYYSETEGGTPKFDRQPTIS